MSEDKPELSGPDFAQGVDAASIPDSDSLLGYAGGEPVLRVQHDKEFLAIGATCTHYDLPSNWPWRWFIVTSGVCVWRWRSSVPSPAMSDRCPYRIAESAASRDLHRSQS